MFSVFIWVAMPDYTNRTLPYRDSEKGSLPCPLLKEFYILYALKDLIRKGKVI